MNTNDFINSIDNKLYNKIRQSKSDAECRRYLKEHLAKQLKLYGVVKSEQLSCKCGLQKRKEGNGFSCIRTDCDANIVT